MQLVWRRMDYRSGRLGGVPLYAFLLLVLSLGRTLAPGSLPKSESLPQAKSAEATERGEGFRLLIAKSPDTDTDSVSDCILIQLGVLDKGNLGDVIRPVALKRLLASVAPPNQCFWYAHPWAEDVAARGQYTTRFSNGDISRIVPISADYAEEVNRFKAFVVGGGGFFTKRYPHSLVDDIETFSQRLTLPVIVLGAAASYHAKQCGTILQKAVFMSGRDTTSTKVFADVVDRGPASAVVVWDPVLSDTFFTDTKGKCWKQSKGAHQQPLCFVLPASNKPSNVDMHRQFVDEVVTPEDVFVSVFPEHQNDDELLRSYPGEVQQILDPMEFKERLCSCRAIVSTDFTAAVLGLHMGVPTLGAFRESPSNEVRELMIDALSLPDQYVTVDEHLSRAGLNHQVEAVRRKYGRGGRRASIRGRLSAVHDDFESHAHHVLFGVIGVENVAVSSLWGYVSAGADDGPPAVKKTAGRRSAGDLKGPSLAAALLTGGGASELPQDAVARPAGGLDAAQKAMDDPAAAMKADHHHAPETGLASASKTGSASSGEAATEGGGLLVRLITNAYAAAIFLVAVIVGISLTPSSGAAARQPSPVKLVPKDDFFGEAEDVTYVQSDGGSQTSSDSDLTTLYERSPTTLRGRSASGTAGTAAATSSKMLFIFNFAMWVSLATAFSGYGKAYLGDTHDPIGLLVLQGATGVVVLCVLARVGVLDLHPGKDLTPAAAQQAGLAAVLHTGQALLSNFALLAGGVAVTNALKAMKPVAAAVFSYLLLGKTCSGSRMAALATIVSGILVLTTNGNNTGGGGGGGGGSVLISAVFTVAAVCCNALRNAVIKKRNPTPPHQTLLTCSAAATVVGVTLMLLRLTFRSMNGALERGGSGHGGGDGDGLLASSWVRMDGVNAALCFVGYNLASFNLLLRLSPVGHAVGNSCKDVVVSASGLLLLGEAMSVRQLGGAAVALAGVLAYNVTGTR